MTILAETLHSPAQSSWADWILAGAIMLVIVNFGHGFEGAVWDIQQLVFRLAMIVALLLLPEEWDVLRVDRWRDAKIMFSPSAGER